MPILPGDNAGAGTRVGNGIGTLLAHQCGKRALQENRERGGGACIGQRRGGRHHPGRPHWGIALGSLALGLVSLALGGPPSLPASATDGTWDTGRVVPTEGHGRALKLVGGMVMIALVGVLLVDPTIMESLMMESLMMESLMGSVLGMAGAVALSLVVLPGQGLGSRHRGTGPRGGG